MWQCPLGSSGCPVLRPPPDLTCFRPGQKVKAISLTLGCSSSFPGSCLCFLSSSHLDLEHRKQDLHWPFSWWFPECCAVCEGILGSGLGFPAELTACNTSCGPGPDPGPDPGPGRLFRGSKLVNWGCPSTKPCVWVICKFCFRNGYALTSMTHQPEQVPCAGHNSTFVAAQTHTSDLLQLTL